MPHFRRLSALVAAVALSLTLPHAPALAQAPPDQIQIGVTHYLTNVYGVPYEVGIQDGIFLKHGINITQVIATNGGGSDVRNVLQGHLPFGDVALPATILANMQGARVPIVAASSQASDDFSWVVPVDSKLRSIKDLTNNSASVTQPGSTSQAVLALNLEGAGVNVASVNIIAAGSLENGMVLMKSGKVSAATLSEPLLSQGLAEKQYRLLFNGAQYLPRFAETVVIASPDLIKSNPDLVKRFVAAYRESIARVYADPTAAGKLFAQKGELPEAASIAAIKDLSKRHHWDVAPNAEGIRAAVKAMLLTKQLTPDQTIDWSTVFDQQFLDPNERVDIGKLAAKA
jgi:NitT/TauT family transport system substrate-binding protein